MNKLPGEQLLCFDVGARVLPKIEFGDGHELALLAFVRLDFTLGVDAWNADARLVRLVGRYVSVRRPDVRPQFT